MAFLDELREQVEDGGLAAAGRPGEAEHDPGRPAIGFENGAQQSSREFSASQPVLALCCYRPLDVLIH